MPADRTARWLRPVAKTALLTAASLAVLMAAPWLLYRRVLDLWFANDDPQVLLHALRHAPWEYSFVPSIWRAGNRFFFTPLLYASFDLDLTLAGLDARFFHVHQLLSLGVAAALLFLLLHRFVPTGFALGGALLLLLGPPTPELAEMLVVRHYVEGLALACAAALAYLTSLERSGWRWTALAGLCLLGALAAKETYLLLAPGFLLLPSGSARRRLARALPLLAVTAAFVLWRYAMLGTFGSSYQPAADLGTKLGALGRHLGPGLFGLTDGLLAAALALPALIRRPRAALAWATAGLLAVAPVVPVAGFLPIASRYVFVAWAVAAALAAWAASAIPRRLLGAVALAALVLVVGLRSRSRFGGTYAMEERKSAEGRFLFETSRAGELLRNPAAAAWSLEGLAAIRSEIQHRPPGALPIWDDVRFCEDPRPAPVFEWDGRMVRLAGPTPEQRAAYCARLGDSPVSGRIAVDGWRITWSLGPRTDGRYALVLPPAMRFDVSREGTFQLLWLPVHGELAARIRYEAPDGTISFSPMKRQRLVDEKAELRWP